MTSEEIFLFGVLVILLLRIIFRTSQIESMVSCSGLYMYDYDGANSYDSDGSNSYDSDREDINLELDDYDTTDLDADAAAEYTVPAETCLDGDDGEWKWKPCSANCGSGTQLYEFVRKDGSLCTLPTTCKLGDGNCVKDCTDYSAASCKAPSGG